MTVDAAETSATPRSEAQDAEEELEVLLAQYIDVPQRPGPSAAKEFLSKHQANTALQELAQSAREIRGLFLEDIALEGCLPRRSIRRRYGREERT